MKRILSLVLATVFFLSMATSAFAAKAYEISEQVKKDEEVGTEIYPYVKTEDELFSLAESPLAGEIVAAVIEKFGTEQSFNCIVGEGLSEDIGDCYFCFDCNPSGEFDIKEISKGYIERAVASGMNFCVCLPVVPATGDNTPIALMASALALSGIALVLLRRKRA